MRGRKPHNDPPVKVHLSLPTSIVAKIELLLFDPVRGQMRYGGMSDLVKSLLNQWIEKNGSLTSSLTGHQKEDQCSQQQPSLPSKT